MNSEILRTSPQKPIVAGDALAACIAACFECAQTCTACADACLGEKAVDTLKRCIRLNLDCAAACDTTGHMLSRVQHAETEILRLQVELLALICRTCGEECRKHASMHEHCRVCAEACRRCEEACGGLLAAFGPGGVVQAMH